MLHVRAVLFDLDDTLLDADAAWRVGVARLADRAPGMDVEHAMRAWAEVFPAWFDRYLDGRVSLSASRAGRVRDWAQIVGVDVPAGAELDWFATYVDGYRAGWALFPDVAGMLDNLAGVPVGIVANGDGVQQREKVAAVGLDARVDVVVVSSDVGAAKPDPAMFHVAAGRLGIPAAQCLVVGDRLDRDVAGALAAGMQAVWLQRPGGPEAATEPPPELAGRFRTIRALDEVAGLVGARGADTEPGIARSLGAAAALEARAVPGAGATPGHR